MSTGEHEDDKLIRRDFFNFLNNLCNSNLTSVLMAPNNQAQLPAVIEHLQNGAVGSDPVAAKVSLCIIGI